MSEQNEPHVVHEAYCFYCTHKWVAVAPVGTDELECPQCAKVGFARRARIYQFPQAPGEGE